MTALISKPGLTSASVLAIPKDWSASWFRSIISSLLQGGDVRNAVGANGITVSGTIASPYATISIGGTGPVTFSGPVTFTDGATFLNVGTVFKGGLFVETPGGTEVFVVTDNTTGITVEGYGPTAGGLVDMTPDTGTATLTQTGGTSAPTVSATWARIGNLAMMQIPSFAAMTSNTATLTFTGLPAAIQPARTQIVPLPPQAFIDAGAQLTAASTVAAELVAASGTITLLKNFSATWTNTATSKGFNNVVLTMWWPLN